MKHLLRLWVLLVLSAVGPLVSRAEGQLLNVPLPELEQNQEMLVLDINLTPAQESQPHRHNAHVFLYVLEGQVEMQVAGGELMTLSPGQTFYESPEDIHMVSRNASDTESARFLVHILKTAGVPVSTPVSSSPQPLRRD